MSENKKPRIAEILGVEVGERFSLMGFQTHYVEFWIKSDGTFETNPPRIPNSSVALLRAVEQPCFVIRKPCKPRRSRWTEQDREDAKALKRLIACASYIRRDGSFNPKLYDEYGQFVSVLKDCFTALPSETIVTLNEIIGGAE